ncbi:MAG: cytochrome C [Pseudomonadota bacterium]
MGFTKPLLFAVASYAIGSAALAAPPASLPGVGHIGKARQDWILQCQGCHRADASGTADTTPAMNGVIGSFLKVPGGREFLVQVPGVSTAPLTDKALASLVNWTLWTFDKENIPADFEPYTASEVGELRKTPLRVDTDKRRAELIALIEQLEDGGAGAKN